MADPDRQIRRGGGGGHPDPEIRGEAVSKKTFLRRQAPRAHPLDLPLSVLAVVSVVAVRAVVLHILHLLELLHSAADPGEGPRRPVPPPALFFDQNGVRRAKKIVWRLPPPLISGSG